MKRVFLIILTVVGVAFTITAQENETMYVMKNGKVTHKIAVANVDSVVFYKPNTTVSELEEAPVLTAPGAGKVRIAVRVPKGTCNGLIATGNFDGWSPTNKNYPFTPVNETETWYQLSLDWEFDLTVKVIAVAENGIADWSTQWGMNTKYENNVSFVKSTSALLDNNENGGEVTLTDIPENKVIYIDVKAWKSEPCTPKNPAGKATQK